jgi:drug/metabolite transporter (DMT)-like permease
LLPPENLWIPVTIFAAFAQTVRNAAQKHLAASLGTLGATLVRFLYGLPFAVAWLAGVHHVGGFPYPTPNWTFLGWIALGAVGQIGGTALLLQVASERNFALGVAYSKTEILQIALFGFVLLGDPLQLPAMLAVVIGTLGVLLMSPPDPQHPLRGFLRGWTARVALYGLASGTCFSFAVVGYRGGALALEGAAFAMAAAFGLVVAQVLQTVLLGAWLLQRDPAVVLAVARAWRGSLFAGFAGAAASAAWFVALAIEPSAHVRTLGLVELLFAYVVSRRVFRERLRTNEMAGIVLLVLALATVTLRP